MEFAEKKMKNEEETSEKLSVGKEDRSALMVRTVRNACDVVVAVSGAKVGIHVNEYLACACGLISAATVCYESW